MASVSTQGSIASGGRRWEFKRGSFRFAKVLYFLTFVARLVNILRRKNLAPMQTEEALRIYIAAVDAQLRTGVAGEHSYRPALHSLLEELLPGFTVINEPARVACGAPDFLIAEARTGAPVAYVECKDIGDADLAGEGKNREQFTRYSTSLGCVIFTDYLDFRLYLDGVLRLQACVGVVAGGRLRCLGAEEDVAAFTALIDLVRAAPRTPIADPGRLAAVMASKARLLAAAVQGVLAEDVDKDIEEGYSGHYLRSVYASTRQELLHDLSEAGFADLYAQTITYGLFAARLHGGDSEHFGRLEAAQRIPRANPFLRRAFQDIAGFDLDPRVAWIVDDLAGSFALADMGRIMADYTEQRGIDTDPLMHFYEDFLAAYDPRLRKARGVWYTPAPVVRFIVRAVDSLLRSRFRLPDGLADCSQAIRQVKNPHTGEICEESLHRVQLLDPAVGTGTFLAEVVRQIYARFEGRPAELWRDYAAHHLLPRLMGFELLMASYAVAHLKLDLALAATGYQLAGSDRLNVFLTNSLEPYSVGQRAAIPWLSEEGLAANTAKLRRPVMVMLGNPPYNGASTNKGAWILHLLSDYKKEPGGRDNLDEKNPKWLNDDYVKFIRLGQHHVERTGEGILAFINPHGFLDNPTFRGMRWQLLKSFDAIYVVNLHGNLRKKERGPDGSRDENVFDIIQGVSINILVRDGSKRGEFAMVYYHSVMGSRKIKYDFLERTSLDSIEWESVKLLPPFYSFVPKNAKLEFEYRQDSFGVGELFLENNVGVVTTKDRFLVCESREEVRARVTDLIQLTESAFRQKYKLKDSRDWSWAHARADVGECLDPKKIVEYDYRHFTSKYLYYTGKTSGLLGRPRARVMRHMIKNNVGLITTRRNRGGRGGFVFCTNKIVDGAVLEDATYLFPLYLYSEDYSSREANLDAAILARLSERAGRVLTPQEVFDYVYGALHDGAYLKRFLELLKVDFPRVPYPRDASAFEAARARGERLRCLHLLEGAERWAIESDLRGEGNMVVDAPRWAQGRVYINAAQYFDNVRREVWEFYIGGYQPAQKWLKDRRGERLGFDGVQLYRRVLHALDQTERMLGGQA